MIGKLIVVISSFIGAWVLAQYFLGKNNKVLYELVTHNNGHISITFSFAIACAVALIAGGLSAKG